MIDKAKSGTIDRRDNVQMAGMSSSFKISSSEILFQHPKNEFAGYKVTGF